MADETIVTEFIVQVDKAISDTKSMREEVDKAKIALKQAAQETGESIAFVNKQFALQRKEIVQNAKGTIEYQQVARQAAKETLAFAQAQKELTTKTQQTTSVFSKLGTVGKFVFGTVLGITAIGAFNALRTAFTSLIADGEKFLQTLFKFQTSVRNLQRRGIDITFKEAAAQVKNLREEFGVFSEREAIAAISNIQLLTANFKFTSEEMGKMAEMAAALSIVTGEDLDEASRKLALFLSSGYSEGLQRAGLAINKLSVSQEAYKQKLIDTKFAYAQLTEVERSHVAMQVLEEQTASLLIETQKVLETNYGKLKQAQADVITETDKLALAVVPLKKAWLDFQLKFLEGFQVLRRILFLIGDDTDKRFVVPIAAGIYTIIKAFSDLKKGITHDADEIVAIYNDLFAKIYKGGTEQRLKLFGLEYDPLSGEDLSQAEQDAAKLAEIANEKADAQTAMYDRLTGAADDFIDILEDYAEKEIEINQKYIDEVGNVTEDGLSTILGKFAAFYGDKEDMSYEDFKAFIAQQEGLYGEIGEITEEGLMKAWEIWRNYTEKIAEINEKLAEDIEDENRDYQNDIADLELDTQRKLEDAARKYRYDQLRAEREFQEKMRRLREEFLFDLEDALRERDALAVLRLIRRYRLDVEQAKRQYELDRQERLEAYRQEIEDIKRQAERKREELAIEHARRLADMQREAEEEREQAEIDRKRAEDELLADLVKEREDAKTERDLALADLKTWLSDQLTALLLAYQSMEGVTEQELKLLSDIFKDYMGKEGIIDMTVGQFNAIMDNAVQKAKERLAELTAIAQQIADLMDQIEERNPEEENTPSEENAGNPNDNKKSGGGYASYGKYTLGEAGREFVLTAQTTKMLERTLGSLNQGKVYSALANRAVRSAVAAGESVVHVSPGSQSSFVADIRLSDGLVGEIVDQAMDETSKVYLTATRERR